MTLVIALKVVMLCVFLHGFPKVALAQRDDLGQTLGFDGTNESLRVSIQIGASHRQLHCLHAGGLEKLPERPCEQRIAIVDEVESSVQESIISIGEIARNLLHPFSVRLRGNPGNLNPASLEVDDEKHEIPDQACRREHLDVEEVRCRDGTPMSLQKGLPRHPLLPEGGGVEPVFQKDSLDRVTANLVTQVVERSSNSSVAPARVVAGHLQDQIFDLDRCLGATGSAGLAAIVLLGDQPPVPSKQRVGCHQGANVEEPFAADCVGLGCEATALPISESPALSGQLLAEPPVLLLQLLDDVLLTAIHPSGEEQHQKLKLQSVHGPQRMSVSV